MKKFLSVLLLSIIVAACFCGCAPKTVYDDMEISKIESFWTEGMMPFNRRFTRTFDFQTGTVTDNIIADLEDISNFAQDEQDRYNNPTQVTAFTEENAQKFIAQAKSLGLYTWKDRYVTTGVDDGGDTSVTIYFSDGTIKSTYLYYEYPPKYEKVLSVFEQYLGASLYMSW